MLICPRYHRDIMESFTYDFVFLFYSTEIKSVPASFYNALKLKNKLLAAQLFRRSSKSKTALSIEKNSVKSKRHQSLIKRDNQLAKTQASFAKLQAGINRIFTKKQVTMLVDHKKKMYWTNDDIAMSISLRYKANPYEYLRLKGFPFPCTRTLQRAMKNIDFSPGILYPVLNLLKHHFQDASISSKLCVLSFDELSIEGSVAYDPTADQVLGPKTQMNVYFLRGLIASWKQPVAFYFDDPFTIENFQSILKSIGDIGLIVVALVTDLGGKNRGLLNKMQVNVRKKDDTYLIRHQIQNPTFQDILIQYFADLPHLLKLLRNNMLKHGLNIEGGYWIRKEDYEQLLDSDYAELRSAWKLTKAHLNIADKKKQKVLPAFQTFSRTVAHLWRKVFVNRQKEADFIHLVNDFCDLLNTRCLTGMTPAKKAFGLEKAAQFKLLQDMEQAMVHLRVGSAKHLFPFQRGFLCSIHSLQALLQQMSAHPYNQTYFLTSRVNQDLAENCFSMIRKVGAYNSNPDPVDAKNRLKLVCLGWEDTSLATCPVRSENDGGFLTGAMIKALQESCSGNTDASPTVLLDSERPDALELTPENFEQVMDILNVFQQCEMDGQEYMAGSAVRKHPEQYPELIASDEEMQLVKDTSWVLKLSDGNLTVPSLLWRNQSLMLYREFCDYHHCHKYWLSNKPGVLKGFTEALVLKYPEVPQEPLRKFIRTIFFARIKAANIKIKQMRSDKMRSAIAQKYLKEQEETEEELEVDEDDYDELMPWEVDEEDHVPYSRYTTVDDQIVASYNSYMLEKDMDQA